MSQVFRGLTPRASMPHLVQDVMLADPTHCIMLGQGVLFRGAGFDIVWPQFVAIGVIGVILFALALLRFRKTISETS